MKTILLQRKLKIGCNFLLFSASKYNTQDKYNQKIQPNNNANIPFCLYNIFWMIALSWKKIQNYHCSKKCIRKSISLFFLFEICTLKTILAVVYSLCSNHIVIYINLYLYHRNIILGSNCLINFMFSVDSKVYKQCK